MTDSGFLMKYLVSNILNDSSCNNFPQVSGPDEKIPPAPRSNQNAGFVQFYLLTHGEKKKIIMLEKDFEILW